MTFAKWLGGSIVVLGAVLATYVATAGASSGDAIYVVRQPAIVLSGAQKTAAGNWAHAVWPGLVAANVAQIRCDHVPTVTGQGAQMTADFSGAWECGACEVYAPSDAELLDAELAGQPITGGLKCRQAKVLDGTMSAAQAASLTAFAQNLAGVASDVIIGSVFVARTPGNASRITAEVGTLAVTSPATWSAARAKGDQPGGVVKTWGKVQ